MGKRPFIHEDFLLQSAAAVELYHRYAEGVPIIDYHCHLPPDQVARDHRFHNLTEIWLYGDHYKWRAMRANGVPERFITGDASDREKFEKWAETVPATLRNPLYHWTHLELAKPFGITDRLLGPDTATSVWEECNALLAQPGFSCRGIMEKMNVVLVCTTDDPIDTLEHHCLVASDPSSKTRMLPAFRPDNGFAVEAPEPFNAWVDQLGAAADVEIKGFESYIDAFRKRADFFHRNGCRLSDHGLETAYAEDYTGAEISAVFDRVRAGRELGQSEILKFKSAMLYELGVMYHERGWTQQFHFGAMRNVNTRMLRLLGRNTGFDTIGDLEIARPLAKLLDRLDERDRLPRTILYNLNPRDNELMAAMIGNFQSGIPGKVQYGSSWWFLDQKDGIEKQIEALSNMGLLSRFLGMLTDSRSFLSYTRHEYFRRVLCNLLGAEMEAGLLPDDMGMVGGMVRDICYNNAARYFGFDLPAV
jgi:glucuronate isomerase